MGSGNVHRRVYSSPRPNTATYLLRSVFTGSNLVLNNQDVLHSEIGQATFYDNGAGGLWIDPVLSAGTPPTKIRFSQVTEGRIAGWVGPATTKVAGKTIKADFAMSSSVSNYAQIGWHSGGTLTLANTLFEATLETPQDDYWLEDFDGAGNVVNKIDTMPLETGALDDGFPDKHIEQAVVMGGFQSDGGWSASGTYGGFQYAKLTDGTWRCLGFVPGDGTATVFPRVSAETQAVQSNYVWSVEMPTAPLTDLVSPGTTPFWADNFNRADGTTGWTPDDGTAYFSLSGTLECRNNRLQVIGTNTGGGAVKDWDADNGLVARGTFSFPYTDDSNRLDYWSFYIRRDSGFTSYFSAAVNTAQGGSGARLRITEQPGSVVRAEAIVTAVRNTVTDFTVIDSTDRITALLDSGTYRVQYVSTTYVSTGVRISLGTAVTGTQPSTPYADNIFVMPYTAPEYDTALNMASLTDDDYDVKHDFSTMSETNNDVTSLTLRPGYSTVGSVTVTTTGSTSAAIVNGNTLRLTPSNVLFSDVELNTSAAGTLGIGTATKIAFTVNGDPINSTDYLTMSYSFKDELEQASSILSMNMNPADNDSFTFNAQNPLGSTAALYTLSNDGAPRVTGGLKTQLCFVHGGFDGSGPNPTSGTQGKLAFMKTNSGWQLLFADKDSADVSYFTSQFTATAFSAANQYIDVDSMTHPAVAVPEVFEPVGYALDTFTDVNGTTLNNHTLESGGVWTESGNDGYPVIQNNKATVSTAGGVEAAYVDTGISNILIAYNWTMDVEADNGASHSTAYTHFRRVDSLNYWWAGYKTSATNPDTWVINEVTAGSSVDRASVQFNPTDGAVYDDYVKCNGDSLECWLNGNKLSYVSSVHNTATKHGVRLYRGVSLATYTGGLNYFYLLPITSSTYNIQLSSF